MSTQPNQPRAAVIVAHPDDETLWCGGYMLSYPDFQWRVVTLCRATDPDRAPRFRRALECLGATGAMADLDDGPAQSPLLPAQVRATVADLLGGEGFELVLTHGPRGEYTRHRRHEECCRAVVDLWTSGGITTKKLWMFAYEDRNGTYSPRVRKDAHRTDLLPGDVWKEKRRLINDVYGFAPGSWEDRGAAREEGYWCFETARAAEAWIEMEERQS